MNQNVIIEKVRKRLNLDEFEVELVLNHALVKIHSFLHKGDNVYISKVGTFSLIKDKRSATNKSERTNDYIEFISDIEIPDKIENFVKEYQLKDIEIREMNEPDILETKEIADVDATKPDQRITLDELLAENKIQEEKIKKEAEEAEKIIINKDKSLTGDLSFGSELFELLLEHEETEPQIDLQKVIQEKIQPEKTADEIKSEVFEDLLDEKISEPETIVSTKQEESQSELTEQIEQTIEKAPSQPEQISETISETLPEKAPEEIYEQLQPEQIEQTLEEKAEIPTPLISEITESDKKEVSENIEEIIPKIEGTFGEEIIEDVIKAEKEIKETIEQDQVKPSDFIIYASDDQLEQKPVIDTDLTLDKNYTISDKETEKTLEKPDIFESNQTGEALNITEDITEKIIPEETDKDFEFSKKEVNIENSEDVEKSNLDENIEKDEAKTFEEPIMAQNSKKEEEPIFDFGEEIKPPTSDQGTTSKRPQPVVDKSPKKKEKSSKLLWVILGLLVIGLLVAGTYYLMMKPSEKGEEIDKTLLTSGNRKNVPPVIIEDQINNRVDTIKPADSLNEKNLVKEEKGKDLIAQENKKSETDIKIDETTGEIKIDKKATQPTETKKEEPQQKETGKNKKNLIIVDEDFVNQPPKKEEKKSETTKTTPIEKEKPAQKPVEKVKPLERSEKTTAETIKEPRKKTTKKKVTTHKKSDETSYAEELPSGTTVSIVVGSHSNRASAVNEANRLRSRGYKAYVEETYIGGNYSYRVKIGKYPSEEAAERDFNRIRKNLKSDAFIDIR